MLQFRPGQEEGYPSAGKLAPQMQSTMKSVDDMVKPDAVGIDIPVALDKYLSNLANTKFYGDFWKP